MLSGPLQLRALRRPPLSPHSKSAPAYMTYVTSIWLLCFYDLYIDMTSILQWPFQFLTVSLILINNQYYHYKCTEILY